MIGTGRCSVLPPGTWRDASMAHESNLFYLTNLISELQHESQEEQQC